MSSVHHHITRAAFRPVALALAAIAAVGCSEQKLADPSPVPALSVLQESATLFETNGALGPAWGTATIKRGPKGVQVQLRVTDPEVLAALQGDAVTFWLASFTDPGACTVPNACTPADIGRPVTGGFLQNAGGQVLGNGPINVTLHAREGDISTKQGGTTDGLVDAENDEIHAVIRSHGAPIPGRVHEQIGSLNGGCPPNACVSVAVAIFQ
jgi:hypothetical protein